MKKTIKKVIKFLPPFLLALFLGLALLPYYREGRVISGGEGSYFLDFVLFLKNYGFSWLNSGVGLFATSLNFGFVFHLLILQFLLNNQRVVNFAMIFLIYFLPFLAIYLLALKLRLKSWPALIISLFYLVNPFMANFLKLINQWNMSAAYIFPIFFWLLLKFYDDKLKLFLFFGLHSAFFAFTNANPPTMVLYQLAIPLFVLIIVIYKEKGFRLIKFFQTYLSALVSFFLFNFWWIANWFYNFLEVRQGYSKQFAISWLRGAGSFFPALWQTLNLRNLVIYPPYSHYSFPWALLILTIPLLLVVCFFSKKKMKEGYFLILGLLVIATLFLSKGVQGMLGGIYEFMVMKVPFFSLFKTAEEKWGLLFVFFLTLFLIFIFERLEKRKKRFFLILLIVYVVYCSIPFITFDLVPDYQVNEIIGSRKFLDKKEYQVLRQELNQDPEQYRVLSLPGSLNYQVALQIEGNKFYTGNDPVLNNTNKAFLAPYNGNYSQRFDILFNSISKPSYLNLLSLFNIKKVVINKDMYPWFGFHEKEAIAELEEIFGQKLKGTKNEIIDFYDVGDYFLPRFFVPEKLVYSASNNQFHLPVLLETGDFPARTAFLIDAPGGSTAEAEANQFIKERSSEILLIDEARSAVNERELRAGVMGMNPGWVLFPYARWKPGGFFYPYVLKKEAETKKQFPEKSEPAFEQHLFFAAKRIYELQKWGNKLDDKLFDQVLGAYEKEMLAAIETIEKLTGEGRHTFPLLAKVEVSFGAHQQRLFDVLGGNYERKESERMRITKIVFRNLDGQLKSLIKKYFSTPEYHFEIPEGGEYEVLVKKENLPLDWRVEELVSGEKGRLTIPLAEKQEKGSWWSLGKRWFEAGDCYLLFKGPDLVNLLTDNWQESWEEDDFYAISQQIGDLEAEIDYKLSFRYKMAKEEQEVTLTAEKGGVDTFWFGKGVLSEMPSKTVTLVDERLDDFSPGNWQDFEFVFSSSEEVGSAKLFFARQNRSRSIAGVEFEDAKIERIVAPRIVIKKAKETNYSLAPQISFKRVNPTKYLVEVQGATIPYFLVFSESFHRGWRVYLNEWSEDEARTVGSYFEGKIREKESEQNFFDARLFESWGKKQIAEEKHFRLNSYANSWYITPDDSDGEESYQLIIEYWPQRLFYGGLLVSFLTLATALGLIFLKKQQLKD